MTFRPTFFALAASAFLSGCAVYGPGPSYSHGAMGTGWGVNYNQTSVGMLNVSEAGGSPFTKTLASEYRTLSNYMMRQTWAQQDAQHFARKGLAAARGMVVMPEALDTVRLGDNNLAEMTTARADLVSALENGGREIAPGQSAVAQVTFDCWAQQQMMNWMAGTPCKAQFYDTLRALQDAVGANLRPSAPAAEPVAAAPMDMMDDLSGAAPRAQQGTPDQQAMFLVFFDAAQSGLPSGANDTLDAVAHEIRSRGDVNAVVIAGYSDASGSESANQRISMKRARAVRAGLISRGVAADLIRVEAHGSDNPLVDGPEGRRDPANRRVQITLQ